jgi:hypothetical protein
MDPSVKEVDGRSSASIDRADSFGIHERLIPGQVVFHSSAADHQQLGHLHGSAEAVPATSFVSVFVMDPLFSLEFH